MSVPRRAQVFDVKTRNNTYRHQHMCKWHAPPCPPPAYYTVTQLHFLSRRNSCSAQAGQVWEAIQALRMKGRGDHGAAVRAPTPPQRNPVLIPAARYFQQSAETYISSCLDACVLKLLDIALVTPLPVVRLHFRSMGSCWMVHRIH